MWHSLSFRLFMVLFVCGGLVASVQFLPPLTASDEPLVFMPGRPEVANFDPIQYCQSNLSGVSCDCFAQKAAQVLSEANARVTGFDYADPIDLAVLQGSQNCS